MEGISLGNIGLNTLTVFAALVGTWFVTQWRLSRHETDRDEDKESEKEKFNKIETQMEKVWSWKDAHVTEHQERRIDILKELADIKASTYHQYSENRDNVLKLKEEVDKLREWRHKYVAELSIRFADFEDKFTIFKIELLQKLASIENKLDESNGHK